MMKKKKVFTKSDPTHLIYFLHVFYMVMFFWLFQRSQSFVIKIPLPNVSSNFDLIHFFLNQFYILGHYIYTKKELLITISLNLFVPTLRISRPISQVQIAQILSMISILTEVYLIQNQQ
jgi:hypothetical protein